MVFFHTPRVRFPFTTTPVHAPVLLGGVFLKRSQGVGAGAGAPFLVYSPLLFVSFPSVLLPTPRRILLLFKKKKKTVFDASRSVQAVAKKKKLLARKRFRVDVMSRACVCVLTLFHYLYTLRRALRRSAHELRYSP